MTRATTLASQSGSFPDGDLLSRRRDGLVLDTAQPVVVVVSTPPEPPLDLPSERSRVVVIHGDAESPAVELAADGTAYLPQWGITVNAFLLPAAEAEVMAQLLAATRNLDDEPVPAMQSDHGPLGEFALADGSLREEYVEPRHVNGNDVRSLLPEVDEVYLAVAATTVEDLAVLAPSVPEQTRTEIAAIDPTLDQDLADWYDETSVRPKIRLLGPASVTSLNGGDPSAVSNLGGTISFITYLACQERGVTGERAAAACGWQTQRTVQNRATNARFLLGTQPDGSDWLPDASLSEGARVGSTPTYELVRGPTGVLSDADLLVRLKFRAQKRGDEGCDEDLLAALTLVTGAPFEAATEVRFKWLFAPGQQSDDEILVGAIHDAAHLLATRAAVVGRPELVRFAYDVAIKANPHSDIAWLDLATLDPDLTQTRVIDRYDEDLPTRSEAIVERRECATVG